MSQQSAALNLDSQGINKTLTENYLAWFDEQVAITIPKPIDKDSLQVIGTSNFELSHFFEQIILKLILYKKFTDREEIEIMSGRDEDSSQGDQTLSRQKSKMAVSPEKAGFSKLESELVMSIPRVTLADQANTSSVGSGLVELGIQRYSKQNSSANINHQVEFSDNKLDEIELDVADADYKNMQHRLLDLEKVRRRNKDFFDDETTAIQASYSSKAHPNQRSTDMLHGSGSKILAGLENSSSGRIDGSESHQTKGLLQSSDRLLQK